jgi:hypothetical protein
MWMWSLRNNRLDTTGRSDLPVGNVVQDSSPALRVGQLTMIRVDPTPP